MPVRGGLLIRFCTPLYSGEEEGLSLSKGWSTKFDTLKPSQTQYRFNKLTPDLLKTLLWYYVLLYQI